MLIFRCIKKGVRRKDVNILNVFYESTDERPTPLVEGLYNRTDHSDPAPGRRYQTDFQLLHCPQEEVEAKFGSGLFHFV